VRDVRDALMVGRNTEGKLVRRPLSPHLQFYRWPISMALSISHRATGIAVSVGTLMLTWWLVAAATSDQAFAAVQSFLASWFGVLILLGWSLTLIFHLFLGIRHLVWDAGYGFDNRVYRFTASLVLAATAALTLIVWIIGFAVW
jgi:succinate dehydrogenase / fumarate reductase, cytochrome b subunit